jgi:hypothetical protein
MQKPRKPTSDFPLYAHRSGKWAKKINGTVKYSGKWDAPQAALEEYEKYIRAGASLPGGVDDPQKNVDDKALIDGTGIATEIKTKGGTKRQGKGKARVAKPYPDFPFTTHPRGIWVKRIGGVLRYFGPVDDPQAALQKYLDEKDDWQAGRVPQAKSDDIRLKELVNRFLVAKKHDVKEGRIQTCTFEDYNKVCGRILECFAPSDPVVEQLRPDDFRKLESHFRHGKKSKRGKVSLWNDITRARVLFKWAEDEKWISRTVDYGQAFRKPSRKELHAERQQKQQKHGKRMFEPDQIQSLLKVAVPLKAMILLGVNCGFGNTDCATVPVSAVAVHSMGGGWGGRGAMV